MKKIIYQTDLGVAVVTPAPWCEISIEQVAQKDVPAGVPYSIVDALLVPEDRTFRAAWEKSPSGIIINPDKAKAIWKDKWRAARNPILASLDIEFMKAVEAGDSAKQAEIAAHKQALRDVTQTEISGNSPDEIKAVWPQVLGEKQ
ncbi:MAG: hypothetical protein EBR82_42630 [Caulobacteraceae bacterium]|nr:hypothetical protein [Caulobacteraceae bacterium]